MTRATFRRFVPALALVLAFSFSASAQFLLDDIEHGANGPNKLGHYWYTFNDASGILTNHRETLQPIAGGYGGSDYAVGMVFSGLAAPAAQAAYATVGLGTNISAAENAGYGSDFNGVTGFSFYAMGPAGLVVNFNVETIENAQTGATRVTDDSYTYQITLANSGWNQHTVNISQLAQEGWGDAYTFLRANVTKISWSLKAASNTVNAGTFLVDDVRILGTFDADIDIDDPPPVVTVCNTCVSATFGPSQPAALLSDFDVVATPLRNELGYFWYSYDDRPAGTSVATLAVAVDGSGVGTSVNDRAVSTSITLGGAYGPNNIPPFAGLGTNLYNADASAPSYFDGRAFTGMYFEYKTDGADPITVELHDQYSIAYMDGEDFQIHLPGTAGQWRAATINFSQFALPNWATARPLPLQSLGKIQILYKGAGSGAITIDNMYLLGSDKLVDAPPPKYTLTYTTSTTGSATCSLKVGTVMYAPTYTVVVDSGVVSPLVEAVAGSGYVFLNWDDGVTTAIRSDTAKANRTFTANFGEAPPPPPPDSVTITYKAGTGGKVAEVPNDPEADLEPSDEVKFVIKTEPGEPGPKVTAIPNEGYRFVKWNNGDTARIRSDFSLKDTVFTAEFELIPTFSITYRAGSGGNVAKTVATGNLEPLLKEIAFEAEPGEAGPSITAVPEEGFEFVSWNDGVTDPQRIDTVGTKDTTFTAVFIKKDDDIDPELTYFTLTYIAGTGGKLVVDGDTTASFSRQVEEGTEGPEVTPIPDEGYEFGGWSDGDESIARSDEAKEDMMVTAQFKKIEVAVKTLDRIVQQPDGDDFAIIAPIVIRAGEVTAGPNPVAKRATVNFFRLGRTVKSGSLSIFDASGNLVRKISISDNAPAGNTERRVVGSWDLTDSKGRMVAEGAYLVRGTVTTLDGARERVSLKISVR